MVSVWLTGFEDEPDRCGEVCVFDGQPLRTSDQCPSYPLQLFVGVFDFPDRDDGTPGDHVPTFEVDSILHEVR